MKHINHIRPRQNTKRALACSLEFIDMLKALLLEFGAVDGTQYEGYTGMYNFIFAIPTRFGVLTQGVMNSDLDPADVDSFIGVYGRFVDSTPDQMLAANKILDSNPYSGKWNTYVNLDKATVECKLDYFRRMLNKIKPLPELVPVGV